MTPKNPRFPLWALAPLCATLLFASCQRKLGWGVLLWANENMNIPSGTVLPVYVKSNIEKKWIVEVPREYRQKGKETKIEVPLAELELLGSKGAAKKRAAQFAGYALIYAETLQNGLPIREAPDNSSARVYRLRMGEVIKILELAKGSPAISAKGDPLPGDWYKVLTKDGTRGYCFSYRLELFEHTTGPLADVAAGPAEAEDSVLEKIKSKTWSASIYNDMLNERKFNLEKLSKHWGFSIGEDTGIANIYTADIDKSFHWNSIRKTKDNAWRFEGTSLTMRLLSEDFLSAQFTDGEGNEKLVHFASLPVSVDDLISQERNRRDDMFEKLYKFGPRWASITFGTFILTEEQDFLWEDFEMLVPDYIPVSAIGRGRAEIKYNMSEALEELFDGVLTLNFKTIGGMDRAVNFLYKMSEDPEEMKLNFQYVPPGTIRDDIVVREEEEPLIISFFTDVY